MIPNSLIGKFLASVWLLACIGILVFAYIQRDIHDMPVATIWLLIFMTFPIGIFVDPIAGVIISLVNTSLGLNYNPFGEMVVYWLMSISLGYLQWFVFIPKLFNYVRKN